jgi:hypothetical protein
MGAREVSAAFDSRDRALRRAPFECYLRSANKEYLGRRVAEVTRKGLARVGPEVCYGLDGRRIGRVDGELRGGVFVEEELGLHGFAGEGSEVGIEVCCRHTQVADSVADLVAVAVGDCHTHGRLAAVLAVPVGLGTS